MNSHKGKASRIRMIRLNTTGLRVSCTLILLAFYGCANVNPTSFFENSLEMKFVSVPGTQVRFSIWDVRVQDYQAFISATSTKWSRPEFEQGSTHPVTN